MVNRCLTLDNTFFWTFNIDIKNPFLIFFKITCYTLKIQISTREDTPSASFYFSGLLLTARLKLRHHLNLPLQLLCFHLEDISFMFPLHCLLLKFNDNANSNNKDDDVDIELGMLSHVFNPRTWEAGAGELCEFGVTLILYSNSTLTRASW